MISRPAHGPVDDAYALAGEAAGERFRVRLVELAAERQYGHGRRVVSLLSHSDMIGVGARSRPTACGAAEQGRAALDQLPQWEKPQTGQVEQPSPKTSGPAQSGQRGC